MRVKRVVTVIAAVSMVALIAAACSSDDEDTSSSSTDETTTTTAMASETIVEVASGAPDFSTLVTAVTEAGLGQTLSGGEYTVFAPTNAAFAKVPPATLTALLADKTQLTAVLTYHVVEGTFTAEDVLALDGVDTAAGASVPTVNGENLTVKASGGKVTITDGQGNTVNVTATDIPASNGVIHSIDGVLLP